MVFSLALLTLSVARSDADMRTNSLGSISLSRIFFRISSLSGSRMLETMTRKKLLYDCVTPLNSTFMASSICMAAFADFSPAPRCLNSASLTLSLNVTPVYVIFPSRVLDVAPGFTNPLLLVPLLNFGLGVNPVDNGVVDFLDPPEAFEAACVASIFFHFAISSKATFFIFSSLSFFSFATAFDNLESASCLKVHSLDRNPSKMSRTANSSRFPD
mmetsp:Transcript_31359/g.76498  ORF Transcript_31359/g.76498 Transcript_31359/m.76498 type:complete len:215 (-) Transcript_31359:175-819(-)